MQSSLRWGPQPGVCVRESLACKITFRCRNRDFRCRAEPQPINAPNKLLTWLIDTQDALPSTLKVECKDAGPCGWGLYVAAQDTIAPGETILSVPLPSCITSDKSSEDRWSIYMAGRVLEEMALGEQSGMRPWLEALPRHVPLPWLYWTQAEIAELQDLDTIQETEKLRYVFDTACEEFPSHERSTIAWALSLVHSRSFINGNTHVWAPGIDLCNYNATPSAGVKCTFNPDACQGAAATEEIAPPQPERPSYFELVAGEDGISAGQEVTISYGSWPNDVLLLFFGWVDDTNPHDSVCIFEDLLDLATFYQKLMSGDEDGGGNGVGGGIEPQGFKVEVLSLEDALGADNSEFQRMVVTAEGIDGRLLAATEAILKSTPPNTNIMPSLTLQDFLSKRCKEMLSSSPTSLKDDEDLLTRAGDVSVSEPFGTALRYRIAKKRTLWRVLEGLSGV